MAKISDLPTAIPLTGAEEVPVVQAGTTRKTTLTELARGDYRKVEDFAQREAIPIGTRSPGMRVYVRSAGRVFEWTAGAGAGGADDWVGLPTNAELLNRGNHTGTQPQATITGLPAALDAISAGVSEALSQAAWAVSPNLYSDPELEYLAVGSSQSWAGINLLVVNSAGAKRLQTPASAVALGILDSSTRRIPISSLPSGRVSASVIIARKDATATARDIRFRLLALDASGNAIAWPSLTGSDDVEAAYYGRNTGAAAINTPTELVIARGVPVPTDAVSVALMIRVETTGTMDISHICVRDGDDPHYRAPPISPKAVANAVASAPAGPLAQAYAEISEVGHGLVTAQPNLFTQAQLDLTDTSVTSKSADMTIAASSVSGVPALAFSGGVNATSWAYWQFSRAATLPGATAVSASFCLMGLDANSGGSARVLLRQMNGAAEITAVRAVAQVATDGSAVVGPRHYRMANVALDPACTDVQLYVEVVAGTSGARVIHIRDMLLAAGGNAAFRRPPTTAASLGITSLPEDWANYAAALPNRFTADELDCKSMRYAAGNINTLTAGTHGVEARSVWTFSNVAEAVAERGSFFGAIPRSDLDNGSGVFSAAVQIYSSDAYSGASANQNTRILVVQRDGAGTEVAGTRVSFVMGTGAITTPTWYRQAGISLHANTATVTLYVGVANNGGATARTVKFGDMLLAPGSNATFRRPAVTAASSSAGGRLFVGPAGSDTAAGTSAAPLATAQAAINKMGGQGTVVFLNGTYTQAQRISPSTLTGSLTLVGRRSSSSTGYDSYPVIYCADKLTGITKTAGRTKVYQAPLISPPTLANFNWAYQDGVPDPRTLIPADERSPQHRGRTHRMHWGAKLLKTTATTLSAALDEIDAAPANDPRAFIDDATGILYFAIVGGGDGTAANIYLDATQGLFSSTGSTRESAPDVTILGLEVRYGGVDTSWFRRAHADELFVYGSATNCLYYSVLSYGTLECAAAGSRSGLTGDGLNGHNGGKIVAGTDYYGHDCRDDGFSDHEGCSARMHGGLLEYNGGTGAAPAYGADDVLTGFISRKNQQRGTYKKAGFFTTGAPSGGSLGGDGGADTLAVFRNCISIGDIVGFADERSSTSNQVRAVCIDCKVYDQSGAYGYDVAEMRDCAWSSASGIARRTDGGATIVKNTSLVA